MKRFLSVLLVVVLTATLAVSGTVAYLQDDDSDVNVMTLGNVSIRQNEEQRVDPAKNGTLTEADVEDFKQAKPIYPYIDVNLNGAMGDDYEHVTFPDGKTYNLFIGDNAIDKLVSVTNTGKSDAYVRTIIALEAPTDKIDLSFHSHDGWKMDKKASGNSIEVGGVKYDLFVCYNNNILKPGETTPYSLLQIILDGTATNEDAVAYGDTYDVLVVSQAVQAAGFADAVTALNAGFGEITATNHPWSGKAPIVTVSTADELKEILKTESDGKTVILKAGTYEGLSFTNPAGYKAKNLTIIGMDGAIINGFAVNGWSATDNIIIDGLTFKNVTFTSGLLLSTKEMSNVTVEDCAFTNDACILQNDKTEKLTNLVVKGCSFTGDNNGKTTAIMLENTENVTVSGCSFTNIDFNVMQAGIISGTVLFDNNKVNGTGDRVFRFVTVNADVTISNNTIVSNGDADGELAKATSAIEITLTNNTWNGMTDANVTDKLINITAK